MIHKYKIDGVYFEGAEESIKSILVGVEDVSEVNVHLEKGEVVLKLERHLSIDVLNRALSDTGYKLSDEKMISHGTSKPQRKIKDFIPLITIFSIIVLFALVMQIRLGEWDTMYAMRNFEGAFFIIFGAFKLLNLKGFVDAYATYDIVAKRSRAYGFAYPFIEIVLGISFLFAWSLLASAWVTLILMLIGIIGVSRALAEKNEIQCACLGVVFKVPMTKVTLFEDLLMGAMALWMIISLSF